jgi:hypothetical protein
VLEPFKGEGAFYNAFPETVVKEWAELEQGRDYRDVSGAYDWVITNPPYQLEENAKRVNSFWFLIDYYTQRARKGVAFLANDRCFSTLTPIRMEVLKQRGWGVSGITVCNVKKWRGRYFFVIIEKKDSIVKHLSGNWE